MKRTYIILLIVGLLLVVVGTYFALTQDIARIYFINTAANEPSLPLGSKVMGTNIRTAKNGDFVVFKHLSDIGFYGETMGKPEETVVIFRLIVSESDTLEITSGNLTVNKENPDINRSLKHLYKVHTDAVSKVENYLSPMDYQYGKWSYKNDSISIFLADTLGIKHGFRRELAKRTEHSPLAEKHFNAFWNKDKFGPLIIPQGKIFVMGDNRDNAMDSRFIGLIDKEKVISVVRLKQ